MKYSKFWGNTELIWSGSNVEIHRIEVLKGGFCSEHKHETKYNMFYVENGELEISIWNDNGIIDNTVIRNGESTSVSPGIFHKFMALSDTIAYEIYYTELNNTDIIRRTVGGMNG